jgi:nitrogen-specific signal transduction histidine kinase/CheY-like chemotaxis protein
MVGTHSDITERKRAEEQRLLLERQVQHAQKLESLGVLAGGIAHDFNNLLMSILGNTDLALMDLSPVSPARPCIEEVDRAAMRAADLTRQMLAYSGKGRFVIEPININEVVEEMAHLLEVSISKKAVLNKRFSDNLPSIMADATQIRQVIMNLITNASEAVGSKSGIITITTGAMDCDGRYLEETYLDQDLNEGQYVYLEISDTGCGMDEATKSRIFDPFFSTKFTGRGLGLAAVLGIVRGHHGAVTVYSEPGRGTTFKILFPVVDSDPIAQNGTNKTKDHWTASGLILLVDDEETIRSVGKRMLERIGFTVMVAVDGKEALRIFTQNADQIALVILDLTMPHMDGEECFRELRLIKPDVKVVMSSGYNEQEVTQRFVGKGLAAFLQKPYQATNLKDVLKKIFNTRTVPD